jgi:NAD(P)-dependent dehydrogenase (short-subunit alcohol dehydrogenase family)
VTSLRETSKPVFWDFSGHFKVMSSPVWLITGASNGFGLMLCLHALKAKHRVVGSVRSRTKSREAVTSIESAGGKVIDLDMEEPQSQIHDKINAAHEIYGRIDILVNSAGFSILGAVEDFE